MTNKIIIPSKDEGNQLTPFDETLKESLQINPMYKISKQEVMNKCRGVSNRVDSLLFVYTFINARLQAAALNIKNRK